MSEESLLVKDLPENEKERIIQSFKDLRLSGVPLKMSVTNAEALIAKKKAENLSKNTETDAAYNTTYPDKSNETTSDTTCDDINNINAKAVEPVAPKKDVENETIKKEIKSDGKCVICYSPVFNSICSSCGTVYGRK